MHKIHHPPSFHHLNNIALRNMFDSHSIRQINNSSGKPSKSVPPNWYISLYLFLYITHKHTLSSTIYTNHSELSLTASASWSAYFHIVRSIRPTIQIGAQSHIEKATSRKRRLRLCKMRVACSAIYCCFRFFSICRYGALCGVEHFRYRSALKKKRPIDILKRF